MSQAESHAPTLRPQVLPWAIAVAAVAVAVTVSVLQFMPLSWQSGKFDSAVAAVKSVLKDPESAQFSGLWAGPEGKYVCGDVNAKNAMGGYVGKQAFMLQVSTGRVEFMPTEVSNSAPLQQQLDTVQGQMKFLTDVQTLCGERPGSAGS